MLQWRTRGLIGCLSMCILCMTLFLYPENTKAGVFNNAYTYFEKYGKEMVFQSGESQEGIIYYATKAKKAKTKKVNYSTLGWRVRIQNSKGKIVDTIYYSLGGKHMVKLDKRTVDGYRYTLYMISFKNMRSRMSSGAKEALLDPNCKILFDACMTVKLNGEAQGGMDDTGPSWGKVYTTYDGIVNAKKWSAASKESLKTYYNKTVEGLFHEVRLSAGDGIDTVEGDGKYCFGTKVTIGAKAKVNYRFNGWTGDKRSKNAEYTFTMGDKDISLKAHALPNNLSVVYYRNASAGDTKSKSINYSFSDATPSFAEKLWKRAGYHPIGWSESKNASAAMYQHEQKMTALWMQNHAPQLSLYQVWAVNKYKLIFYSDNGTGEKKQYTKEYTQSFTMPKEVLTDANTTLLGWSLSQDNKVLDYRAGEKIDINTLVSKVGVSYKDGATIKLYAVWDGAPSIEAEDIYVSLEDAKKGKITPEFLSKYAIAKDIEDGQIAYGKRTNNSFYLFDYSSTDFTTFTKGGYVTQTYCAVDSSKNITKKQIKVHIVDTTLYKREDIEGRIRFFSAKYYKDKNNKWVSPQEGGLLMDSIWREEEYTSVLDDLFQP